ncbi:hypothetical protein V6N13_007654 [Hibiscus sabdariffa]|uniref:Uncharacterized protein n=1 Tax=Hibiscus sabdariffa TaxID=183260 RepID=A0ABR2EN13_9ROSI
MPKNSSSRVASNTGASKKSSLDPSKHSVLTTSASAPPTVINRGKQQQGPFCIIDSQYDSLAHGGTITIILENPTNKAEVQSDGHPVVLH